MDTLWSVRFDGRGLEDSPASIRPARGGNLLIAAALNAGYPSAEAGVLLVDSAGNLVRSRLFHKYHEDAAQDAIEASDGGYLVLGSTSRREASSCSAPWKIGGDIHAAFESECPYVAGNIIYETFAIRLDSLMDTVWTRIYPGREFFFASALPGGEFLLAARGGHGDTVSVLRLNTGGSVAWERALVQGGLLPTHSVARPGGGFVIAGSTGANSATRYSWVAEVDTAGAMLWRSSDSSRGRTWSLSIDSLGRVYHLHGAVPNQNATSMAELRRISVAGTVTSLGLVDRLQSNQQTTFNGTLPTGQYLFSSTDGTNVRLGLQDPLTGAQKYSSFGILKRFAGMASLPGRSAFTYGAGTNASTNFGDTQNDIQIVKFALNPSPVFLARFREMKTIQEGGEIRDTLKAEDAFPRDSVRMTWTGTSNAATQFAAATGIFRWQPPTDYFGDTTFTFLATDRIGQTDTLHYRIRVIGVNDIPSISLSFTSSTRQQSAAPGDTVFGTVVGADADGDVLVYSMALAVPGLQLDSKTGAFRWTPQKPLGPQPVYFEVTDGHVLVRRGFSFIVTDKPIRSEPVTVTLSATKRDTVTLRQGVQFIFSTVSASQSRSFSLSELQDASLNGRPTLYWALSGVTDSVPDFRVRVVYAMLASSDSAFWYASGLDRFLPLPADTGRFYREFTARRMAPYAVLISDTAAQAFVVPIMSAPVARAHLSMHSTAPGEKEILFSREIPRGLKIEWVEFSGRKRRLVWSVSGIDRVRVAFPPGTGGLGFLHVRGEGKSWALPVVP